MSLIGPLRGQRQKHASLGRVSVRTDLFADFCFELPDLLAILPPDFLFFSVLRKNLALYRIGKRPNKQIGKKIHPKYQKSHFLVFLTYFFPVLRVAVFSSPVGGQVFPKFRSEKCPENHPRETPAKSSKIDTRNPLKALWLLRKVLIVLSEKVCFCLLDTSTGSLLKTPCKNPSPFKSPFKTPSKHACPSEDLPIKGGRILCA